MTASDSADHLAQARRAFAAGRPAETVTAARRALVADPADLQALGLLGVASAELGDFPEAVAPLRAAAEWAPPGSPGWALLNIQLARALFATGAPREGLARLTAVEAHPLADPILRNRLGVALVDFGFAERGLPHLEQAAAARPGAPDLLADLAWALSVLGRVDEAETRLDEAIAIAPGFAAAHLARARLRHWTASRNHLPALRELCAGPLEGFDRARATFALFKELDDLALADEAWPVLEAAHVAAVAGGPPWSPQADEALVRALIRRFPRLAKARPAGPPDPPVTPLFIVGLPRTGTTLIERIVSAHSQVRALGEITVFPRLFTEAAAMGGGALNARAVQATRGADWTAVGAAYRAEVQALAAGARFITDKLPLNSLLLGAIDLALPEARLILVSRQPMDALFSAYRTPFGPRTTYGWSHSQADLAAHHRAHERLMSHWRASLGERLIEVSYESLAADPEPAIRALLAACGLAFEEACLRPDIQAGPILTHSNIQARAPISPASIGAWRRYAAQLEPLQRLLAERR